MSQHVMESPSKRVRHDSTDSSYLGQHAPASPIQQTSTGANPDQSLFGFEFSDTPTFGGGVTPSLPYLPSQVPNSKDWIMSPTAAFSTLPEGFGADPLSPGFSTGVPSHTTLKGSSHPRGHRSAHKRGAGTGASSSLYHDDEDFGELGMGAGIAGMAGMAGMNGSLGDDHSVGNALSPGAVIMDEESQEHLSTNRRALADILSRKSRTGRATPDVLDTDEQEATRHGFNNANYSNCSDAFLNSSNNHNNNKTTSSNSSTNGSSSGYLTSFSHLSGALAGNSGSLFEQTNITDHNSNNESTLLGRGGWSKAQPGAGETEIKTEKGSRAKAKATSVSNSTNSQITNTTDSTNNHTSVKEESDDDCNSNQHSQQSAASSHMAGVLAITAAAECLPFPSSDERAPKTTPGKKGKTKRAYTSSLSSVSKLSQQSNPLYPNNNTSDPHNEQGEHSNLSCESNSSGGHSGSAALAGLHAAEVTGSMQASFMAAYGTPAMKLTSSIAASASSANKPISCNCKRSRCLKMYCDCFRLTIYCKDTCRCKECANLESRAVERQAAIASIVDRNPEAFKPRVTADPASNSKAHLTGCHCRKSSCLKKYCECFTGAVPCGERCRCLDCKNGPAIYGASGNGSSGNTDLQQRMSLSAALSAAGVDRSNNHRRKDSIGSESNSMDVMSAIMNDKSKRQHNTTKSATTTTVGAGSKATSTAASSSSAALRGELSGSHGLGSPHMSPHGHLNMSNINNISNMGGFGNMPILGAPYFDPEGSNMSHMTTQSLSYSNDAFGRPMYGNFAARLSKSDSKLAFSPPRPGTDPSSGANSNSNRSVLDNEEAAEVLSVMNSPNAYMSAPSFSGVGAGGSAGGAGGAGGEVPAYRYRDTVMSSVDTTYTAHSPPHHHNSSSGVFAKGLLRADLETADDEDEDILRHMPGLSGGAGSAPGSARVRDMARRTASLGLAGNNNGPMSIETDDHLSSTTTGNAIVSNLSDNSNRFTPYSSPIKGRRPITENMVLSPTLLDLASICEQKAEEEEEEERKQQLTSPDRTRSYP